MRRCVTLTFDALRTVTQHQLLQRMAALAYSQHELKERQGLHKSACYKDINIESLMTVLEKMVPPEVPRTNTYKVRQIGGVADGGGSLA